MSQSTSQAPGTRRPRGAARPAVKRAVNTALESVPESVQDDFVRAVSVDSELDPTLWGPGPSEDEQQSAALEMLQQEFTARRAVMDHSLSRAEIADLLGVSEQAILDRLDSGDLVGLRHGREWRLPSWQFDSDTERGYLPGLARLKEVYPGGVVSLTEWVTAENVELGGSAPAEVLKADDVDRVVAVAMASTAAAW